MLRNLSTIGDSTTDERVPIPDATFSKVLRATPDEARELSLTLPASQRAALALFCNARAHLRDSGRAIASACTMRSLLDEGGHAGAVLFDSARSAPDVWGRSYTRSVRPISLGHV